MGKGEFEWGYVVTGPENPEGTPCSGLVAKMVSLIDGMSSVGELLVRLREGLDENQATRIEDNALSALQILFVDGAVEELTGL